MAVQKYCHVALRKKQEDEEHIVLDKNSNYTIY